MAFEFINLGSGSAGNSSLVRAGRTTLLIDIGFSARETGRRMALAGVAVESVTAILLTHEHNDHVAGAAVASRRWGVPVFCRASVAEAARLHEKGAAHLESLPESRFDLGDLRITPFPVPHDAVETVGFVVEGEGVRLGYATDMGEVTDTVVEHLAGSHILAVEANHDVDMTRHGPYPWHLKKRILGDRGHLSNEGTAELLSRVTGAETRQVVLTHLSETNNTPELALLSARDGLERSMNPAASLDAAWQGGPAGPVRL
ncbi:MAG: MBL fold metallo-hydrolase [Acidobacteria bacterium]|nr:MBL fold metallo-hydrolase [Acidobacteriota bacterium]